MAAHAFTALGALLVSLAPAMAQTAAPKFIVGTVDGFKAESAEIRVKPDAGESVSLKITSGTQVLRVAPGEKDLKRAEPIKITDVASGDHVLVNLMPGAWEARRIVVMSSSDIAKRNEADTLDWNKRGIAGIVASKTGNEITLRRRSLQGEIKLTVTVGDGTQYRRYAPDSVKFADARKSGVSEIGVGDQLRARGQKSEDGLKVTAEEVVFGTFVTKAGPITAVNVEAKEITVKDVATGKPLAIKLTGDSQIKKMPDFAAMIPSGGAPAGGAPGGNVAIASATRPARASPDLTQMLERIPPSKFDDLKAGEMVVVSSTKGASNDRITAIMLVGNAGMLIQMASRQSGGDARPAGASGMGAGPSMMGGGMAGGLSGLNIPGMIP
jgi:hypothetical protein